MLVRRMTALFCLSGLLCFAHKDKKTPIQVVAVAYRAIPHERTTYYHTQGYSNTTCYGSGINWGYSSTATVNCSSVISPPQTYPVTVRSIEVYNKLESAGMIYTVTCTAHWIGSSCSWLIPGDTFDAEIKGTTMWVAAHKGGNMGKEVHPKFRILDIRPDSTAPASGGDAEVAGVEALHYANAYYKNREYNYAYVCYKKAADQGNLEGMYMLGWLYESGSGVTASKTEALHWYEKAASQGNDASKHALTRLQSAGR